MVLVDSTRSGKRIPDALSKTVPIWCAVINRAVSRLHSKPSNWSVDLYTPPGTVSDQEHAQIAQHLDEWGDSLLVSRLFTRRGTSVAYMSAELSLYSAGPCATPAASMDYPRYDSVSTTTF